MSVYYSLLISGLLFIRSGEYIWRLDHDCGKNMYFASITGFTVLKPAFCATRIYSILFG